MGGGLTVDPGRRVAFLADEGDGSAAILSGLRHHGCDVRVVDRLDEAARLDAVDGVDIVLGYGPSMGRMRPAMEAAAQAGAGPRPFCVWWLCENTPPPAVPGFIAGALARTYVFLDRVGDTHPVVARLLDRAGLRGPVPRGQSLRVLGELDYLRRHGLLDLLAVAGDHRARYLRRRGFDPFCLPMGYHPVFGAPLGLERTIDVLFLGALDSRRRTRIVETIERDLKRRGIHLTVPREQRVLGPERDQLVGRSKILLNILRRPHFPVAQRLHIAAGTKTLLVSEPLIDSSGFQPGRHFVSAPVGRLGDVIEQYVKDDAARAEITEAAYRFVTEDCTAERSVGLLLQRIPQARSPWGPVAHGC